MDCAHHAGTTATAICTRCDQPLCPGCAHDRTGRQFCAQCADFLDQRNAQRPRPMNGPTVSAVPASRSAPGTPPVPPPADDVYQGPPPVSGAGEMGLVSGAPSGDVYQGDAVPEDNDAAAPQGDVYQGDVYGGDVYSGEAQPSSPSGAPVTVRLTEEAKEKGSTGRAIIFGSVVGMFSALVWFWAVTLTGYQFGFLAIIIGWLVGVATTAGAGGGGSQVAVLSLVIAAASMIGGDYMINDHFYRKFTTLEIQEEIAFSDGDISDADIALYLETSIPELRAEISSEELEELRAFLAEEASDSGYTDEFAQPAHLPLSQLPLWMGWWEYLFIGLGAMQAFRVPVGDEFV